MKTQSVSSLFHSVRPKQLLAALVAVQLSLAPAFHLIAAATAAEQSAKSGDLIISAPWARAMLPGQPTGGGYLTIENTGGAPDRLIAVTSPNAAVVEIHQMSMDQDVMKMRQITDGLEIPAGGKVELFPGGLHLMFKQVNAPFKVADTVKVTLEFEKSGKIDFEMPVAFANPN